MVNFSAVKLDPNHFKKSAVQTEASCNEIAIIGLALKLPQAVTADAFWDNLANGVDCIGSLPESRKKDVMQLLTYLYRDAGNFDFGEAAYLEEIDKFDYRFFGLSPKEASLMDPNQRLFLETAWAAIEDAGYGGDKLIGTKTGVYLGFNSDSEYKRYIMAVDPEAVSMAVPGNVKPITASRLSYILDLKGPSMIVDTTCSSSLTAVHLACRAMRDGECDGAVVGGIQTHLIPVRPANIGVEASDGRAKTFDAQSDGTGTGEGVAVLILKPLAKALKDRDHIYAIIKGGAANNDGSSIGITAPNALAQEEVLISAWNDAKVDPETITYIEAHGTGTKLGDPIEIEGLCRAFRRYTDANQFCAIGTVKTNIGHLDNAAGIAGLVKAVLALKNKKIPASLHFNLPNRKISFEDSPLYVNNRLLQWETTGGPRRCGVSSFGLSGTNLHLVLEEAPPSKRQQTENKIEILTISAKSEASLKGLIQEYQDLILKNEFQELLLEDICFTANTGRGHYNHRIALIIKDKADLVAKITKLGLRNNEEERIYYGYHQIVPENQQIKEPGDLTLTELRKINVEAKQLLEQMASVPATEESLLESLSVLYIQGAEIDWDLLYKKQERSRVSLPTYQFERNRCWFEPKSATGRQFIKGLSEGALLEDCLVESYNLAVYAVNFSVDKHWVLNEHVIDGQYVLVGTTHLELVMEACAKYCPDGVRFFDVQFIAPLIIRPQEEVEVQIVLTFESDIIKFVTVSKHQDGEPGQYKWQKHIEGKAQNLVFQERPTIDIKGLQNRYQAGLIQPNIDDYNENTVFNFGPRWKNLKHIYVGEQELIAYLEMPETFLSELQYYPLHPALMDNALTTVPLLNKLVGSSQGKDDLRLFLPFSYKSIRVYQHLPGSFYSYVRLKESKAENQDIISFDVIITNDKGETLIEVDEYSLIRTSRAKLRREMDKRPYLKLDWVLAEPTGETSKDQTGPIVIIKGSEEELGTALVAKLQQLGREVIQVEIRGAYAKHNDWRYAIGGTIEDYERLFADISIKDVTQIIYLSIIGSKVKSTGSLQELEARLEKGVYNLFRLSKGLLRSKLQPNMELIFIADYLNHVTGTEEGFHPENAACAGLGKVLDQEYPNLKCRCIDVDQHLTVEELYREINTDTHEYQVAYRNGRRYIEQLQKLAVEKVPVREIVIKTDGVYIISGGAGGLGLEFAKYLAVQNRVNLALLNRTPIPDREQWDDIINTDNDEKLVKKIKTLREVEAMGAWVTCYSVDVSNESELSRVIQELRKSYGRINGVIHSAGIAGDGFIITKDEGRFKNVLSPKIQGTWLLDKLTRTDKPDFFVIFSSNTTLMGTPGQGDYTAANAYQDLYTAYRNREGEKTMTINWPGWLETGMAVDYGVNQDGLMKTLTTAQGIQAFDELLKLDLQRVLVGELIYEAIDFNEIQSQLKLRLASELTPIPISKHTNAGNGLSLTTTNVQNKVKLKGKAAGEYSETEQTVANIWGEVLGYEEFNINAGFFELGGDSVLITKVFSLLERIYPGKVQIGDLFAYPTIAKIAEFIDADEAQLIDNDKKLKPKQEGNHQEKLLKLFEDVEKGNISMEEANDLIRQLK